MLLLQLIEEVSAEAAAAFLSHAVHGAAVSLGAFEAVCPIKQVLLHLHENDLKDVKPNKTSHWERIRLQEVVIVMEAPGIERWEHEVAGLDNSETKSVVELPTRMREEITQYLGEPKESEDHDSIHSVGHDSRIQNDEPKGYKCHIEHQVGLPHISIMGGRGLIRYEIEGYQHACDRQHWTDLAGQIDKEHVAARYKVKTETLEGAGSEHDRGDRIDIFRSSRPVYEILLNQSILED